MLRGSVLITALIFTSPVLWQSLVEGTASVQTALIRFLIALPVAAVLVALLRAAFNGAGSDRGQPR